MWDARSGRLARQVPGHRGVIVVSWSPDSRFLVTACRGSTIQVYELTSDGGIRYVHGLQGRVDVTYAASFAPDGLSILTGSTSGDVRVWDAPVDKEETELRNAALCDECTERMVADIARVVEPFLGPVRRWDERVPELVE